MAAEVLRIMSFTLFPDQLQFYQTIAQQVKLHKRVIACAATGFGKSKVSITIDRGATTKGLTVLFLTESDKIYKQFDEEVAHTININADSKLMYIKPNHTYLAMAQTLVRRPRLMEQFAMLGDQLLILNDEAHVGTATKLLLQLPAALLIGLTATPHMKWAKHLPLLYNGIAIGSQPEWLVDNGRLTPYLHQQFFPDGLDKIKIVAGEVTDESNARVFDTPNSHRFLMDDLTVSEFVKCMIFCASINSAESLGAVLAENGFANTVQHSKYERRSEADQSYGLAAFKRLDSGVNICISVASMNKGFDFPPIDMVVLWLATTSLPRYLQSLGRASRICKETGKAVWRCKDWGGNGHRLGRWDADRDWANLWNKIPKRKEGVAPIKECPKCKYLLRPTMMICPNCGHEFKAQGKDELMGVRTVMLEKAIPAALIGRHLSDLTPIELAQWAKTADKKKHATRVAKGMEAEQTGYLEQFGKAMGYKQGWASYHIPMEGERVDFYDAVVTGLTSG